MFVYVCQGEKEREREINKTIQLCVKSWCKGKVKKSWSGISGGLSVPPTSFVTLLSLAFSLCLYHIDTSAVWWVFKPGYHLSSPVTPQEVPKHHGIIDGKMETQGRKYIREESSYVPFYFFITNCSLKARWLGPFFQHLCFSRWSLLYDNYFDCKYLHVGLLPVRLTM